MRRILEYFDIEGAYGGSQDWMRDPMMRLGGCAAISACDASIYLALRRGMTHLYPYDVHRRTKEDFLSFAAKMKPYLHPRIRGIDRLEIFQEGYGKYLRDVGERHLFVGGLSGERPFAEARACLISRIDGGFPIPFLLLRHRSPDFENYTWHWFILAGYETFEDEVAVQAVTYGSWRWLDFRALWDTGHSERGGMILLSL